MRTKSLDWWESSGPTASTCFTHIFVKNSARETFDSATHIQIVRGLCSFMDSVKYMGPRTEVVSKPRRASHVKTHRCNAAVQRGSDGERTRPKGGPNTVTARFEFLVSPRLHQMRQWPWRMREIPLLSYDESTDKAEPLPRPQFAPCCSAFSNIDKSCSAHIQCDILPKSNPKRSGEEVARAWNRIPFLSIRIILR